jgi:hypothetical protein
MKRNSFFLCFSGIEKNGYNLRAVYMLSCRNGRSRAKLKLLGSFQITRQKIEDDRNEK